MSDPTFSAPETGSPAPAAHHALPAAVYRHLSTDFYPWDEVVSDLKARAQAGQSVLFEAQGDGGVCARFVWQGGQLLGGCSAGRDITFAALMRGLPRARVTLLPLTEAGAAAIWAHRSDTGGEGETLRGTAGDVTVQLAGQMGVLHCIAGTAGIGSEEGGVSYWEGGEPRCGGWPQDAEQRERDWQFISLGGAIDAADLAMFWGQVLAATHRRAALDEAWRQVSLGLASAYPVLDPFTREVTVRTGELHVDAGVPADELQPAMLAAYSAALSRLGLRLSDLPLGNLRDHSLWAVSGLDTLPGGRA